MQKYIGVKEVQAEPMMLGDFIETRGRNPYTNSKEVHYVDEQGYLVKYADGYESWSPKDVFEDAYLRVDFDTAVETPTDERSTFLTALERELLGNALIAHRMRTKGAESERIKMNFGIAIEALKFGLAIRREGWNGKGLFVVKQVPSKVEGANIFNIQSLPKSAKELILKGKCVISYTSQCLIYNEATGRADSWVPSVSDIFADDWEIVEL